MVSTSLASILLLVQILMDMPSDMSTVTHRAPSFQSFFLAFGTMLFAFGGLAIFPSIQNDMREPKRFGVSVLGGFASEYIHTGELGYDRLNRTRKLVRHMQNPSYTYVTYLISMGLGPRESPIQGDRSGNERNGK